MGRELRNLISEKRDTSMMQEEFEHLVGGNVFGVDYRDVEEV